MVNFMLYIFCHNKKFTPTILDLQLKSCMTSVRPRNFSEPQFAHL